MRRSPLGRKTGLNQGKGLARKSRLKQTDGLRRTTRLKARSKKTALVYEERRPLVASLLETRPWCEIRWDDGCQGRAVDVDEIKPRGRGGSILDPSNLQTACRYCHDRKHAEPEEAVARGVAHRTWHEPHVDAPKQKQ